MLIVLNKKRLLFINLAIVISIFSFTHFCIDKNAIQTSSTPISNRTIILDAGHGLPDGGAVGVDGVYESKINLDVVLKLQTLLESSSSNVVLTRSDENGIYETDKNSIREKKISDMKNRVEIANNSDSEIFVSIHMNKLSQSQYSGWQAFYKKDDDESKNIAKLVQENLNLYMKKENKREIKPISGIYLTRNVNIPLVIIECGFLSNTEENRLLQTDSYQNELAWSIYCGLMDYFNN